MRGAIQVSCATNHQPPDVPYDAWLDTSVAPHDGLHLQGDCSILTILLPGPGVEVLRPVWQGWSQACGLVSPRCTAWQPAPPRRRVHTARPRSAPLGSPPLVRRLGGGRRADDVRQER